MEPADTFPRNHSYVVASKPRVAWTRFGKPANQQSKRSGDEPNRGDYPRYALPDRAAWARGKRYVQITDRVGFTLQHKLDRIRHNGIFGTGRLRHARFQFRLPARLSGGRKDQFQTGRKRLTAPVAGISRLPRHPNSPVKCERSGNSRALFNPSSRNRTGNGSSAGDTHSCYSPSCVSYTGSTGRGCAYRWDKSRLMAGCSEAQCGTMESPGAGVKA